MIRTTDIATGAEISPFRILQQLTGNSGVLVGDGEAPDFYESVTVRFWGSGTRVKDFADRTVTETIDYDESMTFTRIPLSTSLAHISTDQYDNAAIDFFSRADPGSEECYIGICKMPGSYRPYIGRHYLTFDFQGNREGISVGTTETNYDDAGTPDTSEDIILDFEFLPWEWGTDPTPPTNFGDTWNIISIPGGAGAFVQLSTYDATTISNWRDIRGTYAISTDDSDLDSGWDSNSVVHHASVTIA